MTTERIVLKIKLTMESDWHVGIGAGRQGSVDRLVRRDTDGLPYIPAKTLTGIWRDACELVARGLDNGNEKGLWKEWVDFLFGDEVREEETGPAPEPPRSAALAISSAHLPESLRKALKGSDKMRLRQAVTFIKPGVKIESHSGMAADKCLRFEEMTRVGAVLQAKASLPEFNDPEQRNAALAILLAGAKMVERIGGKRRRGNGKCRMEVEADGFNTWLEWLKQNERAPQIPKIENNQGNPDPSLREGQSSHEDGWECVNYKLTALTPLVIPARTTGNVIETLDYVPGTYLLPHVTRILADLVPDLKGAITRGDLIVTRANPACGEHPTYPIPFAFSYLKEKGEQGGQIFNQLIEKQQDKNKKEQLKGFKKGYIAIGTDNSWVNQDKGMFPPSPKLMTGKETHNVVHDPTQRPSEAVGGVYTYSAIQQQTVFQGQIRIKKALSERINGIDKLWHKRLEGDIRLGRAKKDEYGEVKLEILGEPYTPKPSANNSDGNLTVWLLSDLLIRDEHLRPSVDIAQLARELGRKLGDGNVELELYGSGGEDDKLKRFAARHFRRDSWHVGWGLPRPTLCGFAAGSCFVFKVVKGELNSDKMLKVEMSGIGERRAEGYGQVSLNHPLLTTDTSGLKRTLKSENKQNRKDGNTINRDDPAFDYARIIEKETWREEIRRFALANASDMKWRKANLQWDYQGSDNKSKSKPPASQLGALRSVVSRISEPADTVFTSWREHLDEVANRKEKWPGKSLDKLSDLLARDRDKVWSLLFDGNFPACVTENAETELKEDLWIEAVQTLLFACIRHQILDERKEKMEGNHNGS